MHWRTALASAVCMLTVIAVTESASAHGVAGKRFFPSTLVIEDPFVNDELTFSVAHIKAPARGDEPAARETEVSGEFSKRITRDLGLSIEGEWIRLDPEGRQSHSGFGNLGVGLRYQLVKDAPHEALLALDLGWDVGGTGRTKVEAQSFDVVKPALLWGKGFGDPGGAVRRSLPRQGPGGGSVAIDSGERRRGPPCHSAGGGGGRP